MATLLPVPAVEYAGGTLAGEQVSLWRDGVRRLRRNKLALAAAIYLMVLALVCLLSLFWTPYKPNLIGTCVTYALPTGAHPLGCDDLGRDSLSRLMVGSQVSLAVGLALYVLLGPSLINIIIAISATGWMDMARLARGQALSIREREFIEAARSGGARAGKIVFGHIMPNALGPIIVQATFVIPAAILTAAFLTFLGFGVPPPTADWGGMASEGLPSLQGGFDPYILLWPAVALSVTLLAFNFFGDGLRDAFDPRQKR